MQAGKSFVAGLAYYPGSPVNVSTAILNVPTGTLVIDYTNKRLYQKTSTTDNSAYDLLGQVSGALTPSSVAATGTVTSSSPSAGIGYATGAGGAVTQATNKSTGVTLNKISGQITMNNAALGAGAEAAFTLTNSAIAATDVLVVNVATGGTSAAYGLSVTAVAAGSCEITVSNLTAGSLSEALVLSFIVFKAVAA